MFIVTLQYQDQCNEICQPGKQKDILVSQIVSQPVSQYVSQSIRQSISQLVSESVKSALDSAALDGSRCFLSCNINMSVLTSKTASSIRRYCIIAIVFRIP